MIDPARADLRRGALLVAAAALVWSVGGVIVRSVEVKDSWTIVFWRSLFAALFVLGFLIVRRGPAGMASDLRRMGAAGLGVALCFTTASTAFVIALSYTTVANVLLMGAGVPLIAALMARILFGETASASTWLAIAGVIAGVVIMVSGSFGGQVSLVGDGLALLIALVIATATVITRRHAGVSMAPAVLIGTAIAAVIAATQAGPLHVSASDFAWLAAFGSLNLGMGLALYVTGARLLPAAAATLIGTLEPALGPIWVWLTHGETPSPRTLAGGLVILAALLFHLLSEWRRQSRHASMVARADC